MNGKDKIKSLTFGKKIVSGIVIAILVFGGLILLLPMSSDVAEGYTMPTGVSWDMDDLVTNSGGAVTEGTWGEFYVHEEIFISHNSSLTVMPGDVVYFDENIGFTVYGDLWAEGTESDIITFTANSSVPTHKYWSGITFSEGEGLISYANISRAESGVLVYLTWINVTHSEISNNFNGIEIIFGGAFVHDNIIANNFWNGIRCDGYYQDPGGRPYSAYIVETEFIMNYNGIGIDRSYIEVYDCSFNLNWYGIYANMSEVYIEDSEIISSAYYDFLMIGSSITTLNTTFDDNEVQIYNSELEVRWYLHIIVVNATGAVPDADVTVTDNKNGTWIGNYITNSKGRVNWIVVTEYIRNDTDWVYYTPHNITAWKGMEIGYEEPNMDSSKFVPVFISYGGKPPPNQPPIAEAGPDDIVNEDTPYMFDGSGSYDPDGFIENYTWYFGDGNFGFGVSPIHIFETPGIYMVYLTVTDNEGATDTDTCIITVEPIYPAPPTELWAVLVTGSPEDVKLEWTASVDDGAGQDDVAGYTIYKSINDVNGPYSFEAWVPALKIAGHTYEWTDDGAGDGDSNNYFYIVRANDTSNNEEQNENRVGKFVSNLAKGWNLMSVPLVQKDTTREVVLQTLDPNYDAVRGYKAGYSRPWLNWKRDKPNQMNDEIEINHKEGYYIYMISSDDLVTAGQVAEEVSIPIKAGWNLVGYPCLIARTRNDALSSIEGNYNKVIYCDASVKKLEKLGPDDLMEPGMGYWVHGIADCTWTIGN